MVFVYAQFCRLLLTQFVQESHHSKENLPIDRKDFLFDGFAMTTDREKVSNEQQLILTCFNQNCISRRDFNAFLLEFVHYVFCMMRQIQGCIEFVVKLVGCCFIIKYVKDEFYFLEILVFTFTHLVRHMFSFLLSNWYHLKARLKEMCVVDCYFWKRRAASAGPDANHHCHVVVFNRNQ